MTTGSFPSDPSARRAILVLTQHDIAKCMYEQGAAKTLIDDQAYVLPFPICMPADPPKALQNIFFNANLARPGVVLVQSPFDLDSYVEASLAPQGFALEKYMHFSTLCMYLGAKEVSVEQVELKTRNGTSTFKMQGEHPRGSANLDVTSEELQKFRAQMNLHDEFDGGPADITTAEGLLRRTGLLADPSMCTLLEMRRESKNQLRSRKLVINLSSEVKNNLQIVGRLHIPSFITLNAQYNQIVHEQHDYTLTVLVQF